MHGARCWYIAKGDFFVQCYAGSIEVHVAVSTTKEGAEMEIEHHMSFPSGNKKIITILREYGIHVSVKSIISSFSALESDDGYKAIKEFIDDGIISDLPCNAKYHYTDEEINNSSYFAIRSTHHWSFPQPEDDYKKQVYNLSDYCISCGSGLRQVGKFTMKKEPTWGEKRIMHLHWVWDEIFLNTKIEPLFISNNYSGYELWNVHRWKSSLDLKTVKQIYIQNTVELGLHDVSARKIINCKKCGNTKYVLGFGGFFRAKRSCIDSIAHDFCKTKELFGDGKNAKPKIMISKRVLRLFLENNIREIAFTPIIIN